MEWRARLMCTNCGHIWKNGGVYGARNDEEVKERIDKYIKNGCCFECRTKGEIEILTIKYKPNHKEW